jgi:hypothetical protein
MDHIKMDNVYHAHHNQDLKFNYLLNVQHVVDLLQLKYHVQVVLLDISFNKLIQQVKLHVLFVQLDALNVHQQVLVLNVELVFIQVELQQIKHVLHVLQIVLLVLMEMYRI